MADPRIMPIMGSILMSEIPFAMISPHEAQAQANHGQTLTRLADRGGLSPSEALSILDNKRFGTHPNSEASAIALINRVREWRAAAAIGGEQ